MVQKRVSVIKRSLPFNSLRPTVLCSESDLLEEVTSIYGSREMFDLKRSRSEAVPAITSGKEVVCESALERIVCVFLDSKDMVL